MTTRSLLFSLLSLAVAPALLAQGPGRQSAFAGKRVLFIGIGELGVTSIPFEVFTETGLEIKEKSPFKDTFTIELANGSNGYLPTPRQHDLGGYETWLGTNRVEREASVKITAKALELLQSVRAAP